MSIEEKLNLIIETGFMLFLLGLLIATVGLIILMVSEHRNRKLEREAKLAEYAYENDPRTQLRRLKEEEAFNSIYFDTIQEFYNGV